jgi:hypothetical protein
MYCYAHVHMLLLLTALSVFGGGIQAVGTPTHLLLSTLLVSRANEASAHHNSTSPHSPLAGQAAADGNRLLSL